VLVTCELNHTVSSNNVSSKCYNYNSMSHKCVSSNNVLVNCVRSGTWSLLTMESFFFICKVNDTLQ